jgi:hypothetical protein
MRKDWLSGPAALQFRRFHGLQRPLNGRIQISSAFSREIANYGCGGNKRLSPPKHSHCLLLSYRHLISPLISVIDAVTRVFWLTLPKGID